MKASGLALKFEPMLPLSDDNGAITSYGKNFCIYILTMVQ